MNKQFNSSHSSSLDSIDRRELLDDMGIDETEYKGLLLTHNEVKDFIRHKTVDQLKNASIEDDEYSGATKHQRDLAENPAPDQRHERSKSYQEYVTSNMRERNMSRRYSAVLKTETKSSQMQEGDVLADAAKRHAHVKSNILWGIINCLLALYLFVLVAAFWDLKVGCGYTLDWWLFLYLMIQCCHIARKLCLIGIWRRAKDPSRAQTEFDLFYMVIVIFPEMALFIWGNFIVYGDAMENCRTDNNQYGQDSHVEGMWWTSLILIIYGYFYMCFVCGVCCIGVGMWATYRAWSIDPGTIPELPENGQSRKTERLAEATPFVSTFAEQYKNRKIMQAQLFGKQNHKKIIYGVEGQENFRDQEQQLLTAGGHDNV